MSSKMVVSFASLMVVLAGCSSSGGSSSNNGQTGGGLGGIGIGNKDGGAPTTETSKPSGGTTKDAGTTEQPTGGTCKLEHVTLSDNECGKCQASKCCTQWTACDNDMDCLQLMGCVDQCQGDEACLNTCAEQFPNNASQQAALGVLQCASGSCSASCN